MSRRSIGESGNRRASIVRSRAPSVWKHNRRTRRINLLRSPPTRGVVRLVPWVLRRGRTNVRPFANEEFRDCLRQRRYPDRAAPVRSRDQTNWLERLTYFFSQLLVNVVHPFSLKQIR